MTTAAVTNAVNFEGVLRYGTIGLGLLLFLFSFHLLRKEQDQSSPRRAMLRAIYVYMCFSIGLCLIGGILEIVKYYVTDRSASTIPQPALSTSSYPGGFNVYGRVEDVDGQAIPGVEVTVTEMHDDGSTRPLSTHRSGGTGSFFFKVDIPADSRVRIETKQDGYRVQEMILQRNAVTLPATLARVKAK